MPRPRFYGSDGAVDRGGVGHVAGHGEEVVDRAGTGGDGDLVAGGGESPGDSPAYAAIASRDQDDPTTAATTAG